MKKINWTKVFFGVMAAAILILVITFFKRNRGGIDYKELIKAKDEQIELIKEHNRHYEQDNKRLEDEIVAHKKQDSILIGQLTNNRQNIKSIDDKIKNIPVRIAAIATNDDSIRAAFAKFGHDR